MYLKQPVVAMVTLIAFGWCNIIIQRTQLAREHLIRGHDSSVDTKTTPLSPVLTCTDAITPTKDRQGHRHASLLRLTGTQATPLSPHTVAHKPCPFSGTHRPRLFHKRNKRWNYTSCVKHLFWLFCSSESQNHWVKSMTHHIQNTASY